MEYRLTRIDKKIKMPLLLAVLLMTMALVTGFLTSNVAAADTHTDADTAGLVNPVLLELQAKQPPQFTKRADRVYASEFLDYSNFGFIEGDDGVIVIDSGWFPSAAGTAIETLRRYTDKPVVAIIYTHMHMDHFGGIGKIMAGQNADVPVYGPGGWRKWMRALEGIDRESMLRRVYLQMGMMLPKGPEGTVGNGIGPSPNPEPPMAFKFPPTIDVYDKLEVEIAGVKLHIMPMEGDVPEHLWVWLPEDRVLFSGDSPPHGVFPAVETARFEIDRNPQRMLDAVETTLALNPSLVVPGHGRLLQGEADIQELMSLTRDAIEFLVDQTFRFYLSNRSIDELLDTQHLPPAIAAHPDLQPYYHRWEWMAQQRFVKLAGFIDDSMDYLSFTDIEEARQLIPALGGRTAVLERATKALANDPRWAAQLATYLLLNDAGDADARALRQQAFQGVAATTISTNQRNYLLGIIREERGEIDFTRDLAALNRQTFARFTNYDLLRRLKYRFRAEDADDVNLSTTVAVDNEAFFLSVQNNVLRIDTPMPEDAGDAALSLSREDLLDVVTRVQGLSDIAGWDQAEAAMLAGLIE